MAQGPTRKQCQTKEHKNWLTVLVIDVRTRDGQAPARVRTLNVRGMIVAPDAS